MIFVLSQMCRRCQSEKENEREEAINSSTFKLFTRKCMEMAMMKRKMNNKIIESVQLIFSRPIRNNLISLQLTINSLVRSFLRSFICSLVYYHSNFVCNNEKLNEMKIERYNDLLKLLHRYSWECFSYVRFSYMK